MSFNVLLEELVRTLGGCGLYQWLLCLTVHLGKTVGTWSMLTMTFVGQDPGFRCGNDQPDGNHSLLSSSNRSAVYDSVCHSNDTGKCSSYEYDSNMHTIVSEWDLICDRKWIPASITSIQMMGVLLGGMVAGHTADLIGRKPTLFVGLLVQVVFNLVGYFSVGWKMYAAMRFLIGVGLGIQFTVMYSLIVEFASVKWRPVIIMAPSFPLQAALFALVSWGWRDWKAIHLTIAVLGVPFLLTWWCTPESFRWLVTKKRFDQAENVVKAIAFVNRTKKPDIAHITAQVEVEELEGKNKSTRKYSIIDLFRTRESTKKTIGLLLMWFSSSFGFYGITFGVKSLTGDLYLNMFILNIVEAPAYLILATILHWFGRKKVCSGFYTLAGITGITVGVIQFIDKANAGPVTNAISIVSKLFVACGWQAMILITTEAYPTVVRTIAYSIHSGAARVGAIVAPLIVFMDTEVPGLLYFVCGVLMIISAGLALIFKETKDQVLEDVITDGAKRQEQKDQTLEELITDSIAIHDGTKAQVSGDTTTDQSKCVKETEN